MPDTFTYTTNLGLPAPAAGNTGYVATWQAILNALDALTALGTLAVTTKENPSTSLNVKVSAGSYRKTDGTIAAHAGTAAQAVTANATNYVYLTAAGVLTVNTTGFVANSLRLATVVAGATTITSVADARVPWSVSS